MMMGQLNQKQGKNNTKMQDSAIPLLVQQEIRRNNFLPEIR
jgi:hypothetical protein